MLSPSISFIQLPSPPIGAHCQKPSFKWSFIIFPQYQGGLPVARSLLAQPSFDPLGLDPSSKVRAYSVYVVCIVLCIVLTESVCASGIRFDFAL